MDFYKLRTKSTKEGAIVYPDFIVQNSKDLLVKGRAFYAVWDERRGLWSRNEMDVARLIDEEMRALSEENGARPLLMSSYESKSWTQYKAYISSLDDSGVELDQELFFADDIPDRKRYCSRKLPYSLTDGTPVSWEELVGTLYAPEEREKIEWAIGSIVAGDSKKNQKFLVFYGAPGTGKSTIMNVVEKLFEGYWVPFDAKALTSSSNAFALTPFKNNPLVAIQQDGDLSKIEDNTRLNSIVSHEVLSINEKYKQEFNARAIAFLFLGTNEPVKITGAKSGIIRRLIDVHPTGNLITNKRYLSLMEKIPFELGDIANHCLKVYQRLGKNYYSTYRPTSMLYETDVFFNYVEHSFDYFFTQDGVALEKAWQMYKEFCEDSLVRNRLQRHQFRTELQTYFDRFEERALVDGHRMRNWYSGFRTGRFIKKEEDLAPRLILEETESLLDNLLADCPAQYATAKNEEDPRFSEIPRKAWSKVKTTLADLDTSKLHYVQVPENLIIIDFDIKDEEGNKSLDRNLEAAASWPATYAELSKGGKGVHLHYYYTGAIPIEDLANSFDKDIEVKTLLGTSSLRRRLTLCNALGIAEISTGLPIKEEKPLYDEKAMRSEKAIRDLIIRNLLKKIHPGTKPSIEFIKKILQEAYESGIPYDVSDMHADVYSFAMDSTNHARYCMDLVREMHFMSEAIELELKTKESDDRVSFFDVEVFPNLFIVCWKFAGEANVVRMINPSAKEIDEILGLKLVGFNCRRYDNHILYAAAMGYSIHQLYELSQRIVEQNDRTALFGAAYNVSYTDIYDFSSKKQSLKKFEIELGFKHLELGLPWNQDVPEELWEKVAEYCENDVLATEAVFDARRADFLAREILAELSGLSVNHSTQQHTARIIFGTEKNPQKEFLYTDLSEMFPGYSYEFGKSIYKGEEVGEGGLVRAKPGRYFNVSLLDVASMHPTSIEMLNLFGPYTEKFSDLKRARIAIKHRDFDSARRMLDGKLAPYLSDEEQADALSYALKIVINIVYGLTSASFPNAFRDPRNKDNIVAKRGALFMLDLMYEVEARGFQVVHIKTDSIKIPDATPEIIDFVTEFGQKYGYDFEHEATYKEFVLFNDAVYIAKDQDDVWHATGAMFQHPYVYKTVLSGEPILFEDYLETRNVTRGDIYLERGGHKHFVGRIGQFVAVTPELGGALLRCLDDKEYAVAGTKGFFWEEASVLREHPELHDQIDIWYYEKLAQAARDAIEKASQPPESEVIEEVA